MISDGVAIVYDLRDPGAWRQALAHRRLWGHRLTDLYPLDQEHVLIVFRPGGRGCYLCDPSHPYRVEDGGAA